MMNTTYLSNASLVESGDLFKIMELRYPYSLYDKNGYYNTENPVSNSLELIRWYRNCEMYLSQLAAEAKKGQSPKEIDFLGFKNELKNLKISSDVFINFGITEYSKVCMKLYSELKLLGGYQLIHDTKDEAKILECLKAIQTARDGLSNLAQQPERFNLCEEHEKLLDDLHVFLKNTENAYFIAFDLEIHTTNQAKELCPDKWRDDARLFKLILENALQDILIEYADVLRFYVKLEDTGLYGHRLHTVVFLNGLKLTEEEWLKNLRENLQKCLANKSLIDNWLKTHNCNIDLNERVSDDVEKMESDIHALFQDFYQISFGLINWNAKLQQLNSDLKFKIDSSFSDKNRQMLEYWGFKYLVVSNKYIYFNPYTEGLQPSIKYWNNPASIMPITRMATIEDSSVPLKLARDHRPKTMSNRNKNNEQVVGRIEVPAQQRRRSDFTIFYDANNDITKNMILDNLEIDSKETPKFKAKKIEENFKISVGPPDPSEIIDFSKILIFKDFVDYVIACEETIFKHEVKNKSRLRWAKIFYNNTIHHPELLAFLIQFEHFISVLRHSKNAVFLFKSIQDSRPESMSEIGSQYLILLYKFHTQNIGNKIKSDYGTLVMNIFGYKFTEEQINILQVQMRNEQIQKLNDLMRKAQKIIKEHENKTAIALRNLKYDDLKLWQKAFETERIIMRWRFSLCPVIDKNLSIMKIFNAFKSRLSGSGRTFNNVDHILLCHQQGQFKALDIVLIFDNARGIEDEKKLSQFIQELWKKTVEAEVTKKKIQKQLHNFDNLAQSMDLIPGHEKLGVKYLYVKNNKSDVGKLVISDFIPFFISQTIFLQDSASDSTFKLSMSRDLTNLFKTKIAIKKEALIVTKKVQEKK